jgi:homoserine dehydrogenase
MAPFRIALIGFGNIGSGLVRHLIEHKDLLSARLEGGIELAWIADKEFERPRPVTPPPSTKLTTNWREIMADPTVDAVVELVGVGPDGKPSLAYAIAKEALAAKKHFITANKGLIAVHGGELHDLAERNGALLLYEASVGAGIPLISSLQNGLSPDRVKAVHGIVNGTCNYILSRMEEDSSLSMETAVKTAQELGYAEPDPRFDVDGDDTAYKIVILGSLAFGQELRVADVHLDGITKLGKEEMAFAQANNLVLKLLASAVQHPGGGVELTVGPAYIPKSHVISGVRQVYNAVLVDADPIGQTMYFGRGAGQGSTGSGLLADVIFAAKVQRAHMKNPLPLRIPQGTRVKQAPDQVFYRYYLRVRTSADKALGEKVGGIVGGQSLEAREGYRSFIFERISQSELDKILGKLADAGVSSAQICTVRFALGEA